MSIPKSKFHEGLELCERNAERLYNEAFQAFQNGNYLCSFILGFNCWEEIGKAFLILDNWDDDLITEKKWRDKFLGHHTKIKIARYRHDQLLADQLLENSVFYKLGKEGFIDFKLIPDIEYTKKMVDMRTACVYVDYDFEEELWKSPMEFLERLDSLAMSVRRMADLSKNALKIMKKRKGII